jgi:stress response protein YsnF
VVETPVQEQVNLRQEHVHIERRPVDRPAKMDEDYRERSIEAEERAEEAVVSKEARVKEELVVNKDVRERTETVEDTVRRTEVEVEDDRTGTSRTGTTDRDRR